MSEDEIYQAKLIVDGFEEREVMTIDYSFTQATDIECQPSGIPRGGEIKLKVKARNDGNVELFKWMIEKDLEKDGTITIPNTTDGSTMQTINFEQAFCVKYDLHWEEQTDTSKPLAYTETISLACKTISVGELPYNNDWELDDKDEK